MSQAQGDKCTVTVTIKDTTREHTRELALVDEAALVPELAVPSVAEVEADASALALAALALAALAALAPVAVRALPRKVPGLTADEATATSASAFALAATAAAAAAPATRALMDESAAVSKPATAPVTPVEADLSSRIPSFRVRAVPSYMAGFTALEAGTTLAALGSRAASFVRTLSGVVVATAVEAATGHLFPNLRAATLALKSPSVLPLHARKTSTSPL
eukprot:CAMPEP_0204531738 /NCGR_PEP_ID=MMETSP0661-20131031/11333_1 /ASSEMBLY_ACC=CAM_ASM_000606 /TAXON_ID=109239 /ORGANISM="Alexandrium margalefi, Strain AMGDE01CS-322" /LENGTH=220 /DNA_ID=CAMNT_0051537911 /DNA_START=91 /DNA_END=755 /DNA_ORIENTATION=-